MVEGTNLAPAFDDYLPDAKDVSAYKRFTGSVQWLACQTPPRHHSNSFKTEPPQYEADRPNVGMPSLTYYAT